VARCEDLGHHVVKITATATKNASKASAAIHSRPHCHDRRCISDAPTLFGLKAGFGPRKVGTAVEMSGIIDGPSRRRPRVRVPSLPPDFRDLAVAAGLFQFWDQPGCNCPARAADSYLHQVAATFAQNAPLTISRERSCDPRSSGGPRSRCSVLDIQAGSTTRCRPPRNPPDRRDCGRPEHSHSVARRGASRDLKNSVLCAQRRRHVQRTRTDHVPRQPEIAGDLAQQTLDIGDRTFLGVSQRGHDVCNAGSIV